MILSSPSEEEEDDEEDDELVVYKELQLDPFIKLLPLIFGCKNESA